MRVFVTGATGFVGSAIVQQLIGAGHQVLGLSRSDANAKLLADAGAIVHKGDLEDLESLKSGAAAADGVIHAGFIHDFSRFKEVCDIDRIAIETLGGVYAGSDKPIIVTSGIGVLNPGSLITEETVSQTSVNPRLASEKAALALAEQGVRISILRLPPSVHGTGEHGFVPMLIDLARQKGVAAYIGEGLNRWPAVHRLDAALLYRLALEHPQVAGTRIHAVADEGVAFKQIAEVIGRRLNIPVASISPEEAVAHFGWFTHFAAMDIPSSATKTKQNFGWYPVQPGLINDIDQDSYFID